MAAKLRGTLAVTLVVVVSAAGVAIAADVDKALINADGRRKAAENGLREIKAKSRDQAEAVRVLYTEAASRNNAWLDIVCQAIHQGASTAPDVSAVVDPAASALVAWVSARNRALGIAELTGPLAGAAKKRIIEDLTTIASAAWKINRGGTEQKRRTSADALKDRLRWRGWEEVQ